VKISTLIKELEALKDEHGDIEAGYYNDDLSKFCSIDMVWLKKSDFDNTQTFCDDNELGGYFAAID